MPRRGYRKGRDDDKEPLGPPFPLRLPKRVSEAVQREAHLRSLTQAQYLRLVLDGVVSKRRPALPQVNGLRQELIHHLGRIGNNLNQLAKHAHAGFGLREPEIRAAIELINRKVAQL